MEIIAFIILILVWYYGYSLLSASESIIKTLSAQNTELINTGYQIEGGISTINSHLDNIETHAFRAGVDLEYLRKKGFKPIQDKLDEIATLSVYLSDIEDKLGLIKQSMR